MGARKTREYNSLIIALLMLVTVAGCGVTIREYSHKYISGHRIRVLVTNKTYETGATYAFKNILEDKVVKRGGIPVDAGEDYEVAIVLMEVKSTAVSYAAGATASAYNLEFRGFYTIAATIDGERKVLHTEKFLPIYTYFVSSVPTTEIDRQKTVIVAANQITDIVYDNLVRIIGKR